eukprot:EG_transcript_25485
MFTHGTNFIVRGLPSRPNCVKWSPLGFVALGGQGGVVVVDVLRDHCSHAHLPAPAKDPAFVGCAANLAHFLLPLRQDTPATWVDFAWAPLLRAPAGGDAHPLLAVVYSTFAVHVFEVRRGNWSDQPILLCVLNDCVELAWPSARRPVNTTAESLAQSRMARMQGKVTKPATVFNVEQPGKAVDQADRVVQLTRDYWARRGVSAGQQWVVPEALWQQPFDDLAFAEAAAEGGGCPGPAEQAAKR